jgi:sporulation protein YlmC with PRC-barrel domain
MLTKILKAGVAGSLLLASAAYAAENSTSTTSDKAGAATSDKASTSQASTSDESSFKGDWRASKVVGLNVYNAQNENVGSINDLLMDKSGGIKAAVISVGGFLGMGAHLVAVPFDKMKFSTEPVAYSTSSNAPAGGAGGGAKPPSTTTTGSATGSPATASKPNPWYPDHAMFDATKDQLKSMPEFKYSTD